MVGGGSHLRLVLGFIWMKLSFDQEVLFFCILHDAPFLVMYVLFLLFLDSPEIWSFEPSAYVFS